MVHEGGNDGADTVRIYASPESISMQCLQSSSTGMPHLQNVRSQAKSQGTHTIRMQVRKDW